jgi:hypothetical protein
LIWADYRGKKLVQNVFTLQVNRDDDDGIILFLVFFCSPISTANLKRNHLHFSLTFRTDVCRHRRSCTVKDAHSFDTWNENGKRLSQDAEIKHQTHTHNGHIGKQLSYWQKKNLSGVPPRQSKKKNKKKVGERWWSCRFDNGNGPLFHQPMGLRV